MGFYMGQIWATHMGLTKGLQHGSIQDRHGQTIYVPNGNHIDSILDLAQVAHIQPAPVE